MNLLPPGRTLWAILMIVLMCTSVIYSQSLQSPRGYAQGSYSAFGRGLNALSWNPAGLTGIEDWEVTAGYYYQPNVPNRSYTLDYAAIGKRLAGRHSFVLQLSPGSLMEFDIPSTFSLNDSTGTPLVNSYDKKITYSERYALGYGFRWNQNLSIGLSANYFEEQINDTKYSVDTNAVLRSSNINTTGRMWNVNLGLLWSFLPGWTLGTGITNLASITVTKLPEEESQYSLHLPRSGYAAIGFSGWEPFHLNLEAETEQHYRFGAEWKPLEGMMLRGGVFCSGNENFTTDAFAIGIGGIYQFIQADLSYIKFIDQTDRKGSVDITRFEESGIDNIDFNPFTSDRISLSFTVPLGNTYTSLTHIESADMTSDIYPSSIFRYALNPIGVAHVANRTNEPVDVRINFYIPEIMDEPTDTRVYSLLPNTTTSIPFYAVFNHVIRTIRSMSVYDATITVVPSGRLVDDDRYQLPVLIRGNNDWNGDIASLQYFITPTDPSVLSFSRSVLSTGKSYFDTLDALFQQWEKAKILFQEFISRLTYVNDPISRDYVQYPSETLTLRGGDCDDMTVAYATLLSSVGIHTAFIDVVPPGRALHAHIYMMFDTGIRPGDAGIISDNPKRYIIRKNTTGTETIWIPVETTVIQKGFEEAWRTGAEEYFQDVEVNSGILEGWVHIVDVEPIQ